MWVIKTHYPLGKDPEITCGKVLCCVRNPLDVVASMFNFWSTQTQNLSVQEEFKDTPEWAELVRQEITAWRDFHRFWIKENKGVFFLRFEDLTSDPESTLMGVFRFLLGTEDLSGTQIEANIKALANEAKPKLYKPRQGKANKAAGLYTEQQMAWISETLSDLVPYFHYSEQIPTQHKSAQDWLAFNQGKIH